MSAKTDDPKARMMELARKSGVEDKGKSDISEKSKSGLAEKLHPPHGERGDFVKLSITLPPDLYKVLMVESAERKAIKRKDARLSDIIRDALAAYLTGK